MLARGGYAASGLIHMILGGIAFAVAASGHGQSDQTGALTAIAAAPLGFAALWAIAVLLAALGLYHGVHGFALRIARDSKRRWRHVSEWSQGVVFLAMAAIAVAVALGARPDPDESAQETSRGLLTVAGGPLLLGAAGAAVGIGGIAWIVMGVRRSFRRRMSLPHGRWGAVVSAIGVVGFVAKGAALAVVGVVLVVAAVRQDPDAAGGLDAAIASLRDLPAGGAIVVAIGAGFVAYGVFCILRARYADLDG